MSMNRIKSRYRKTPRLSHEGETYLGVRAGGSYPTRPTDIFYDVEPEDTLHKIAYLFYRDASLWWVVADFNDLLDPFSELRPGDTLRLPSPSRLWMEVLA